MGYYTQLCFATRLRLDDGERDMIRTLMDGLNQPTSTPDHLFFQCPRWRQALCSATLNQFDEFRVFHEIKNYDEEWEKLLAWLTPYIADPCDGEVLGTIKGEDWDLPQLVMWSDFGTYPWGKTPKNNEHGRVVLRRVRLAT